MVKLGKLAVTTGLYDLYEVEFGRFRLTDASIKLLDKKKLSPLKDYFRAQNRFRALSDSKISEIQDQIYVKMDNYKLPEKSGQIPQYL